MKKFKFLGIMLLLIMLLVAKKMVDNSRDSAPPNTSTQNMK